jgi:hypothetical protein
MPTNIADVGAPDPERNTSPILDVEDEEFDPDPDLDRESGVCYFNDVAYALGTYVRSGSEVLHCEERGVWVRRGEVVPE